MTVSYEDRVFGDDEWIITYAVHWMTEHPEHATREEVGAIVPFLTTALFGNDDDRTELRSEIMSAAYEHLNAMDSHDDFERFLYHLLQVRCGLVVRDSKPV